MKPEDVTAVAPEVVAEVLRSPESFLAAAAEAAPGWSTRYGGPEGVAQLATALQEHLGNLRERNAALRGATVLYLNGHGKLGLHKLSHLLAISKTGIVRILTNAKEEPAKLGPYAKLATPKPWKP